MDKTFLGIFLYHDDNTLCLNIDNKSNFCQVALSLHGFRRKISYVIFSENNDWAQELERMLVKFSRQEFFLSEMIMCGKANLA